MDSFSRQVADNTQDLNNGQRRAINVRVNGEEHAAVSDQGDAYIYFPLDGQMMNISELAFKLIIGDGFSTATGDDTNPRTNWEYGDNLYPTYQDWLARYPVGSRIDVDGMAGYQCVDYPAAFWAAKVGAWCVTSQNPSFQKWTASSMWSYPPARQANLFDGRFIEIPDWKDIQAGDWIIWGSYDPTYTGVGHVAMATAKPINLEGASTVAVLQQNKLGNSLIGSPVDTGNLLRAGGAYGDFLGAFRYNDPTWLASIPEN